MSDEVQGYSDKNKRKYKKINNEMCAFHIVQRSTEEKKERKDRKEGGTRHVDS